MEIKQLFQEIASNSGVSGYEDNIAAQIQLACPWVDELRRDTLGNLIMLKRGQAQPGQKIPRIMLAAHMDEIGLIITKIEKEGFLRFSTIGGFDQRVLLGQVTVHGSTTLRVIGAKPPHVQRPGEQSGSQTGRPVYRCSFDSDGQSGQGCRRRFGTTNQTALALQGSFLAGKAFDDRAGVTAVPECFKALDGLSIRPKCTESLQSGKVGLRGAITSTYGIVGSWHCC